jgi:hypothetical protein
MNGSTSVLQHGLNLSEHAQLILQAIDTCAILQHCTELLGRWAAQLLQEAFCCLHAVFNTTFYEST